jgi:hypothetical protein
LPIERLLARVAERHLGRVFDRYADRMTTVKTYRVIAQGDDAVGTGLALDEAIAVYEFAQEHGKRHVAIVDETTSGMIDVGTARDRLEAES